MADCRTADTEPGFTRLFALLLLLTVFFLPLHLHAPNIDAKIVTECACHQGSRTVACLAPTPADVSPLFDFQPLVFEPVVSIGRICIDSAPIRAPPTLSVL